jgi:hypothetical protein
MNIYEYLKYNEKQQLQTKLWPKDLVGSDQDGDLGINGRIITNKLHGVEPFLRSRQSLRYSRISQHHYSVHKSPPLVPILSQINPAHTVPTYLSKIHFNIVTCYLRSQPIRGSFLGNSFVNTQQYWSRC